MTGQIEPEKVAISIALITAVRAAVDQGRAVAWQAVVDLEKAGEKRVLTPMEQCWRREVKEVRRNLDAVAELIDNATGDALRLDEEGQ